MTPRRAWLAVLALLPCWAAQGADDPDPGEAESFEVHPVIDLAQTGATTLLGGAAALANTSEWPAAVWGTATYKYGIRKRCSGSVVGARVLLTAAHCIPLVDHRMAVNGRQQGVVGATCRTAGEVLPAAREADLALCLLDTDYVATLNVVFETVSTQGDWTRPGTRLLGTGWGCRTPDGQADPAPTFRTGTLTVKGAVGGTDYVETMGETGLAFLCEGDSGAGAYRDSGNARRLVAVNAKAGEVSTAGSGPVFATSRLVSLATPEAVAFIAKWLDEARRDHPGVAICGISKDATRCKGV